jgi:preprotein translocase subunit YajC
VVFYLLIIRPQQMKMKQRQELIAELRVGDRVETIGGIQGVVMSLDTESLELQIAPEVTIMLMRRAVAARVGAEE